MPPKIVGLHLGVKGWLHQGWRVTSSTAGRAYLVNLTTGARSREHVEDLYRWLDEGYLEVRGKIHHDLTKLGID